MLTIAGGARADDASQSASLARAEQAERELSFAVALAAYESAERADPASRQARRARARIEFLRARSEGDFVPLVELERMRRGSFSDPVRLAAFEQRVSAFPAGRVRREARALVADSYLRLDLLGDAVRAHRAWLEEPELDDAEWLRAANGLALARARLGDLDGSLETLRARGLGASAEAAYVELALARRWARPVALGVLGAFIVAALVLGRARSWSRESLGRALSPLRCLVVAWTLGGPLALAALHREETWRLMQLLVPAQLAVVLLAAAAGAGLPGEEGRRRQALGVVGVAAQVAVAYLAFDASGALLGWVVTLRQG